jgi:ABC-type lipoprotein release transport system permease subunit
MLWLKLGWRNLRRNRRRTIIELAAIAGSVFIAMYFNNLAIGSYTQMIDSGVRMGSGHIGVYQEDYLELRRVDLTVPADRLVPLLREVPGVQAVYSRLYVPGLVRSSRDSRPGIFLGLDFEAERASNPLLQPKRLAKGSFPGADNPQGAVIGTVLAEDLGLRVGNKFVLMTQGPGGEIVSALYRVTGILHTGLREFDAGTVLVSRESLAAVIGQPGRAHEIALMLRGSRDIPAALPRVRDIVRAFPGSEAYEWRDAMPSLAGAIRVDHAGLQITVIFL